jgi:hypothetical protein
MAVTGQEVLEWAERSGFILTAWQRWAILHADWSKPFELHPLWPEPRKPVVTRRVQRRRQTRAERKRHFVIIDELG